MEDGKLILVLLFYGLSTLQYSSSSPYLLSTLLGPIGYVITTTYHSFERRKES